ncbi:MAG: phosphoglucomutase (alpha-D-glucose-1,6-bisphosphate-dependent) [Candidatus Limnocylindrales bacterium]
MAHELAGQPAEPSTLVDLGALADAYYTRVPDPAEPSQRVAFGTSGHRGSSLSASFNEAHIIATTAAICRFRRAQRYSGPLFMGRDTHALSEPAFETALEVLVAAGVDVRIDRDDGFTPTPAVSHAILSWNREHPGAAADGIVVTPSHNPPADGGFKYNPPSGGPADARMTGAIQDVANELLRAGVAGVRRTPLAQARTAAVRYAFLDSYVDDLARVIDLEAIAASGVRLGVDPLGGAAVAYWPAIADRHGIDITVTNRTVDPTFGFMTVDWDGKIRMDPSSPYAMARLIDLRSQFDLALGNDADADRFGVVTPAVGLLNPNHYLAAAAAYLFGGARDWGTGAAIGKTLVSSSMQDRIAASLGRPLFEVPVGFKWFVDGLLDGSVAFGGEESAGMSFLRRDGQPWSTDKDGIIACLLAAEMTAKTGRDPGESYAALTERFGAPVYRRIDAPATPEQKAALGSMSPDAVAATTLAGEPITAKLTAAPGNGAAIGGLKVVTEQGWFAARPSGTENVTKLYAESFIDEAHLERIIDEAQTIMAAAGSTRG